MAHKDIAAISKVERRIWQQKIQSAVDNTWAEVHQHLPEDQRGQDSKVFKLLGKIYVLAEEAPNEAQFRELEQSLKEASAIIEGARSAANNFKAQRDTAIDELQVLLHDLCRGSTRRPEIRQFFENEMEQMRDMAFEILPDQWEQDFGWSYDEAQALFEALNRDPHNIDEPDMHYGYTGDDVENFRDDLRQLINKHMLKKGK